MTITESTRRATGPVLEWLTPNQLEVEGLAQRSYDDAWAEKLAKNWDDDKLGVLEVSKRGERYFVTDGQHRRAALIKRSLGAIPVPCNVYLHEDVSDQAKRYVADNVEKRRPNPVDSFRIKVTAKDPQAVAIQSVLDDYGLVAKLGTGSNYVACIAALNWVYDRGQSDLVSRTLGLLIETFGDEKSRFDGELVKATGLLLSKLGNELDIPSFVHKVTHEGTAARIMGTARAHKMATGKALYLQTAEVLLSIYNKGRTTKRLSL